MGMDIVAVSVMGANNADNIEGLDIRGTDAKNYNLLKIIDTLNEVGIVPRLSVLLHDEFTAEAKQAMNIIDWCRSCNVPFVTFRNLAYYDSHKGWANDSVASCITYVKKHQLKSLQLRRFYNDVAKEGNQLRKLPYGAEIFGIKGVSVCITNCLTDAIEENEPLRNIIYYPDGRVYYDWRDEGARIF